MGGIFLGIIIYGLVFSGASYVVDTYEQNSVETASHNSK